MTMNDDDDIDTANVTALANKICALLSREKASIPLGEAALIWSLGIAEGFNGLPAVQDDKAAMALYRFARETGAKMRDANGTDHSIN